jgi:branched-subunit amino acid transport protein
MNIWLVMLFGGIITFLIRFSFIYLFGRLHVSERLRKALHYVPPAVLSALIFPELFIHNKELDISLDNQRLLAGVIAVIVAYLTKNTLVTILAGMLALLLLQVLL